MSSRLLTVIEVSFIALVGLAVLAWFRGDTLLMTSASVWPLNWPMFLQETLSVWDDSFGLGSITVRQVAFLPLALFGAAAGALGMSASLFQKILVYGWFAGSGLAMWWLCTVCRFGRLVRLVAALFYMVNPYALVVIWSQSDGLFMPFFVAAPFGLALFIYAVLGRRGWGAMILANILLLLMMGTAAFGNPAFAVIFWLPCVVAAVGWIILYPRQWYTVGRYAFRFVFIWLAFNSFWLVPLVVGARDEFVAADHQLILQAEDPSRILRGDLDTLGLNSVRAVDAWRLTGLWSVPASYGPDPYYVWARLMSQWPAGWLSFLIPALLIFGLWSPARRRTVMFFWSIFILAFLLVIGIHPPLAGLRLDFLTMFPALLRAFRAIFGKFGLLLALSMAPLIGLGVALIYNKLRAFTPRLAIVTVGLLVTALIGIGGWPVWTGDVIQPGGYLLQPGRVKIPEFYHSFQAWSENQPGIFRVLSLPLSKTGSVAYRWGTTGYIGGDFIRWFSPGHPVLFGPTDKAVLLAIAQTIEQELFLSPLGTQRLFGLLNIGFVLVHRDFHWPANANLMMFNDAISINRWLDRGFFHAEAQWGDLVLKRLAFPTVPKLYGVREPILVVGSGAHVFDPLSLDELPWPAALVTVDSKQAADDRLTFPDITKHVFITTSIDQEKLAQARRDLSTAQSQESPQLAQREIAVRILQHSFEGGAIAPLYAPWVGTYVVSVAHTSFMGQKGFFTVTIVDASGEQHQLSSELAAATPAAGSSKYKPLGQVRLPRGTFQIRVAVSGETLGSVPPGTFLLYTPFVATPELPPVVDFKRLAATRYTAAVPPATGPFLLVFSEAYHRSWQLAIRQPDGSLRWLAAEKHMPVNSYANGWWVDDVGTGELVIAFRLQRYFWFGLGITVAALMASLFLLGHRLYWYSTKHAA